MFRFTRVRWALTPALLVLLLTSRTAWPQSDVNSALRRADADARAGRFDAAREGYTAAIRQGASLEQDATRSELLALCYANSSPADLPSGIRWFRNALRLSGDERVRAELADTLVRAGQYEDAAEQYQVLAKAHPGSTIYIIALSRALLQAGRAEDALQALQAWLTQTPGTTAVRLEYARILSYQKHFSEARQQYETVLRSEPANLVAQIGVAKVTSWQGNQEAALPMYDGVLAHNPTNYDALVGKAFCLLWMGRQAEALPLLQTAARRNPNDADVREALAHLRGAEPMPPVAATPPSLPEVPAAARFAQGEAAPPISVPPPTSLPEMTAAQRSAGATAFAPGPFKQEPAASGRSKASRRKPAAPKEQAQAPPAAPEEPEPQPERNVFGFNGMSNGKIAVILSIIVGVLLVALFVMSSREKDAVDDWHDKPRPLNDVMKVSRPYRAPAPAVRPAPPSSSTDGPYDRTLAGIPRRSDAEQRAARAVPLASPQTTRRHSAPPQNTAEEAPTFVTQLLPRSAIPALPQVRLNGLHILLVGSEEMLMETERRTLQSAGAEVMVEANWISAVSRMTSGAVHAIVLNESIGDNTRQIYQSVAKQYPGWLRRMLLVLAEDDGPTRQFISNCQAKCILQPFRSAELLAGLGGMFGRNGRSEAAVPGV